MLTHLINCPSFLELNTDGRVPKLWITWVYDNFPRSRAGISITRYNVKKTCGRFLLQCSKTTVFYNYKSRKTIDKKTLLKNKMLSRSLQLLSQVSQTKNVAFRPDVTYGNFGRSLTFQKSSVLFIFAKIWILQVL